MDRPETGRVHILQAWLINSKIASTENQQFWQKVHRGSSDYRTSRNCWDNGSQKLISNGRTKMLSLLFQCFFFPPAFTTKVGSANLTQQPLVGGIPTPEHYETVSFDDEIPNWIESPKKHVPNHQSQPILTHGINSTRWLSDSQLGGSVHIFQLQFSDVKPGSAMGTRPNRPSLNMASRCLGEKKTPNDIRCSWSN